MTLPLRNGVQLPLIGLGTYRLRGSPLVQAVDWAIEAGITCFDTAVSYANESNVYQGITQAGLRPENVFITSKVGPRFHRTAKAMESCDRTFRAFNTDVIDLMLIHWPGIPRQQRKESPQSIRRETWEVLEHFYKEGRFRAIGVSNYEIQHIEELMTDTSVKPMVNQIEVHPRFPNTAVREYCAEQGIQVMAYSSLGVGDLINHRIIQDIAKRHQKSASQVTLQ